MSNILELMTNMMYNDSSSRLVYISVTSYGFKRLASVLSQTDKYTLLNDGTLFGVRVNVEDAINYETATFAYSDGGLKFINLYTELKIKPSCSRCVNKYVCEGEYEFYCKHNSLMHFSE